MRQAALRKATDSLGSPTSIVYGSVSQDPATWDADRIYGCVCEDYGFLHQKKGDGVSVNASVPLSTGYDCSLKTCPYAYNPRKTLLANSNSTTRDEMLEKQLLFCSATDGYFRLSFKGEYSEDLYAPNVTLSDLEDALERIQTVGDLLIESVSSSSSLFCSSASNITVTFLRNFGNLPLLELSSEHSLQGGSLSIYAMQDGWDDSFEECGGYGLCNTTNGTCSCFGQGRSSDGVGEYQGTMGDCSYDVYN